MITFFRELFIIDGTAEGSVLELIPYILTAIALGVVLSGGYFVLWRLLERRVLTPLIDNPEGVTLAQAGLDPKESFLGRVVAFLLRSPSCMLYKTLTHRGYENRGSALTENAPEEAEGKKKKEKPHYTLTVTADTHLTLREERVEYARRQAGQQVGDIVMPLVYTCLVTLGAWLCLMCSLDAIVAYLLGV